MSDIESNPRDICDTRFEVNSDLVDVLIAGGGIGGLVTALCLHRAGFSVRVHERLEILEPIGFGIVLQPFCVKLLNELGLKSELDEIGIRIIKSVYYSQQGQVIYQEARGIDAGYKWPSYSMHRGNFQQLLLRHVYDEVGETSVRLGQKLVAFRSYSEYVEVDFVNSTTGDLNTERAKVLVGADGINSSVRKILYPDEGGPLWRGLKLSRGVTQTDKLYLDGRTMVYMGNPNDAELVVYPVNKNLVNWVFVLRISDPDLKVSPLTPDWNNVGHKEDILSLISKMKLDFLDIDHLVQSSMIINEYPMTDRDPLSRWTHDRVTLLGDAAHPMQPNGGNGASQAILDARGLVLSFRQNGVTPQGLQTYDDLRRSSSNTVVLAARQYGPERILKIVDERAPNGFHNLSDVISSEELEGIMSNFKQVTSSNVEKLNQEPPLF
jgi:2-polyprenyl-6-methoxyphenol hydroxylase-like FAD-dependent oxidoreductase